MMQISAVHNCYWVWCYHLPELFFKWKGKNNPPRAFTGFPEPALINFCQKVRIFKSNLRSRLEILAFFHNLKNSKNYLRTSRTDVHREVLKTDLLSPSSTQPSKK